MYRRLFVSKQSSEPSSDFLRAALMRFKRSWRNRSRLTRSSQSTPIRPKVFKAITNLLGLTFQSFQSFQKFQSLNPITFCKQLEQLEHLEPWNANWIITCYTTSWPSLLLTRPSVLSDLPTPGRTVPAHPSHPCVSPVHRGNRRRRQR